MRPKNKKVKINNKKESKKGKRKRKKSPKLLSSFSVDHLLLGMRLALKYGNVLS